MDAGFLLAAWRDFVTSKPAHDGSGTVGAPVMWARGLFRLWLVLSTFWVAGTLAVTGTFFFDTPLDVTVRLAGQAYQFPLDVSRAEMIDAIGGKKPPSNAGPEGAGAVSKSRAPSASPTQGVSVEFDVDLPDGRKFAVTAPEGATQEDANRYVEQWQSDIASAVDAALQDASNRAVQRWTGVGYGLLIAAGLPFAILVLGLTAAWVLKGFRGP